MVMYPEQACFWPKNQTPVRSCPASGASLKCIFAFNRTQNKCGSCAPRAQEPKHGKRGRVRSVFQKHFPEPKRNSKCRNRLHERSSQHRCGTKARMQELYNGGGQTILRYGNTANTSHHIKIRVKSHLSLLLLSNMNNFLKTQNYSF